MNRESVKMSNIETIMRYVGMLAGISPEDFTMTSPHTDEKFPYHLEILRRYFTSRSRQKNLIAQKKAQRSEEHTSELQSLMRISYAVFCLQKKTQTNINI